MHLKYKTTVIQSQVISNTVSNSIHATYVLAHLSKQAKPDEFLLQDHYIYLIVPRRIEQCCVNLIFVYSCTEKNETRVQARDYKKSYL